MLGEPVHVFSGEDIGTRMEHLMQLQEIWSTCYAVLTQPNVHHSNLEKARALTLEIGLDLLQHHLESWYNHLPYARTINDLPKDATKIPTIEREQGKRVLDDIT